MLLEGFVLWMPVGFKHWGSQTVTVGVNSGRWFSSEGNKSAPCINIMMQRLKVCPFNSSGHRCSKAAQLGDPHCVHLPTLTVITPLAKEVMFSVAFVCLFVCLFVSNITQKVMNRLQWNSTKGWGSNLSKWLYFGVELCLPRWVNERISQ